MKRGARGRFAPGVQNPMFGEANGQWRPAMERFVEKLAFDPFTGCVMWTGGLTSGAGHGPGYGAFWFEKRRVFAHRWAAEHIHGFDIDGLQVDHWCPCGASTLCVEHVRPETALRNNQLQHERPGRTPSQSNANRQYWLFIHKGIEEPHPLPERTPSEVPFYLPPAWLAPHIKRNYGDDCPF